MVVGEAARSWGSPHERLLNPKGLIWQKLSERVLSRQCLDRRIPDKETLIQEIAAWEEQRNQDCSKIDWQFTTTDYNCRHLRLKPVPEILGFVPNQYDSRRAAHRNLLDALPKQLEAIDMRCFQPIRYSTEFINASGVGLPLHLHRQLHPAKKDFAPIANCLAELLAKGEEN